MMVSAHSTESWSPAPMQGVFSQQLSKIHHQKIRRMSHRGRKYSSRRCRMSFSKWATIKRLPRAATPQPPFLFLEKQIYGETEVNVNHSKVRVKLHLWLHTLYCAWTLRWQRLTFSWKRPKTNRVGGRTVGSDWGLSIMRRVLQHNFSFCSSVTHVDSPKSPKHCIKGIVLFILPSFLAFIRLVMKASLEYS